MIGFYMYPSTGVVGVRGGEVLSNNISRKIVQRNHKNRYRVGANSINYRNKTVSFWKGLFPLAGDGLNKLSSSHHAIF